MAFDLLNMHDLSCLHFELKNMNFLKPHLKQYFFNRLVNFVFIQALLANYVCIFYQCFYLCVPLFLVKEIIVLESEEIKKFLGS